MPVVVHSFPSGDEAFRERVEAMLATGRFDDPMRLGEALRDVYPDIGVTRQLDFGRLRPHDDLWYVYRDGHMMGDGASEP